MLLALGAGYLWLSQRYPTSPAAGAPASTTGEAVPEEYVYVAEPHISLRINGKHDPVIYPGTPLLLSVRVANQRAMNAALLNHAHEVRHAALLEKLSQGKAGKEDVDGVPASLQKEIPIKDVELGREGLPWMNSVHFNQRTADGQEIPLPWELEKIGPATDQKLVLDASKTAELDFALGPTTTANLAAGEYVVVAVLEVKADVQLPSTQWRGRVETEPVTLKVLPQAKKLSPPEVVSTELDYVSYFLATHQGAMALIHSHKAVAASPTDINANIAMGDSKAMQNDLPGALEAYETARREFYRQHAEAYERPALLLSKIYDLRARMARGPVP